MYSPYPQQFYITRWHKKVNKIDGAIDIYDEYNKKIKIK